MERLSDPAAQEAAPALWQFRGMPSTTTLRELVVALPNVLRGGFPSPTAVLT